MNFFSMLIAILTTVVSAHFHYYGHILRVAGDIPGNRGHVFGSNQITKCDKLRYKLMMRNRNRPDLVRQIYHLNLEC